MLYCHNTIIFKLHFSKHVTQVRKHDPLVIQLEGGGQCICNQLVVLKNCSD